MKDGEAALKDALEASPDLVGARAALAIHLVQTRRHGEAKALLAARRDVTPDDRRADADLGLLEQRMRLRAWMLYGGAALALVGLLSTAFVAVPGLAAFVLGAFVVGLGWFAFQRNLDAIVERQKFEEISQGLRRLLRRSRTTPPVS